LFTGGVFYSVAMETTLGTKPPVHCACKRTGAKYFSQSVLRRCRCSAFGYPRLDHFP
jgi:ribosomal protein L37E